MITLALALAGGLGAVLRWQTEVVAGRRFGTEFPRGTLTVNILGSLVLGLLTGAATFHAVTGDLTTVAGTGFCGGFTTFSAASLDVVRLAERQRPVAAASYAIGTLLAAVGAAAAGLAIAWAA